MMKLRLSHGLLVALEHYLGDSPGLLAEFNAALGGELKPVGGPHTLDFDEDLVQRIDQAITRLDKREWLQPFYGPLTAAEIKQQWRTTLAEAGIAAV